MQAREQELRVAERSSLLQKLGPGLITGASDDDPSGIATYSQVGAQFGFGMLWTMLLSTLLWWRSRRSARVGRVTGRGIAANLREHYPRPVLYSVVALVLLANVINLSADIGAMTAAAALIIPAPLPLPLIDLHLTTPGGRYILTPSDAAHRGALSRTSRSRTQGRLLC